MSIRFLKRSLCVLLSCTVLVFSCVFMPRQRAEALSEVGVIGTCAGIMGLALLLYGVSVGDPSVFDANDAMTIASKAFVSAVGLGAFTDPSTPLCNTAFNATTYLKAAKEYANTAYSSGACSSVIQGPGILVDSFIPLPDGKSLYFDLSSDPLDISYSCDSFYFSLSADSFSSRYLSIFYDGSSIYFLSNSPSSVMRKRISLYYNGKSNIISNFTQYHSVYFKCISDYSMFSTLSTDLFTGFSSLGYPIHSSSISVQEFIDTYLVNFDGSLTVEDLLCRPVSSGACDVFNSSKSLDSYHVDSPGNDVLYLGNLLTKTGCDTVDDVVSKVYTGELSASDVIGGLDCRPYVDVDVDTGSIAIPGDTTNSRPIALDQDLSIPSDITDTDTYIPLNPPADSDNTNRPSGSYTFPLSNFFPFCLPWDIYKVLSIFHTSPKAPVISIPLGSFFSDIPGVDKDTIDYVCTIDLGDENFKKWFQILRLLESIGIIVGFVLISRYLIHGGD